MLCSKEFSITTAESVAEDCFDPDDISWSQQQFPSGAGASATASMSGASGSFAMSSQNIRNATSQNSTTVILTGTFNKLTPGSCVCRLTFDYSWLVLAVPGANFTIQVFMLGTFPDVAFQPAGSGSEVVSADGFIVPGANEIQIWVQIRGSNCPGVVNGTPCTSSTSSGTITLTPLPLP